MILSLFLVFLLIALALIVIGFWTGEGVYSIIGFIFVFFLSVSVLMNGSLAIPTGSNVSVSYTYVNGSVTGTDVVGVDTYDYFDDSATKWFGRFLAIVSAIGFVLSMIEGVKAIKRRDD